MTMTLSKMREAGIRTINRVCPCCGSHGIAQVDGLPGDVEVGELGKAWRCLSCGAPETVTRPNWQERNGTALALPA